MQTRHGNQYEVRFPGLPLAVYREIAAHLRQVEGVETGLYPATPQQFDYYQSQVGGLWIRYDRTVGSENQAQIDRILAYYQDRYNIKQEVIKTEDERSSES